MKANEINSSTTPFFEELPRQWQWLLALGLLLIVTGTIGIGMAFYVTLASVLVYGGFILAAGLLQLWQGIEAKEITWSGRTQHFLVALLYLAIAGLIIWDPIAASAGLTLFLAALFAAIGVVRIIDAIHYRRRRWQWLWLAVAGVINLILAMIIFLNWPFSGLWVIGLFVAIEMIINGWLLTFFAWEVRKNEHEKVSPHSTSSAS